MNSWLMFAILALVMWGFWGFFPKLAVNYIDPKSALIYEVVGAIIIGFIVLAVVGFKPQMHFKGATFAILAGIANLLGILFFLYAVSKGKVSTTVVITALYPIVTIILASLILKETVTLKQGVGILFALVGILLMSV